VHHFFVTPDSFNGSAVLLPGTIAHQIANVLRLVAGDHIVLLDNTGWEYEVQTESVSGREVTGKVVSKRLSRTEPATKIVLYQGVLKTSRFEFILQKGTELGVCSFVPVICERSIIGEMRDVASAKWERWLRIIAEAAEQSERARLPQLQPATTFQHAIEEARGISILASERARAPGARTLLGRYVAVDENGKAPSRPLSVNIFIGPEGGFTSTEISRAQDYGILPASLGPRILRSETAALAMVTLALSTFGDMGR
jgi:16S rRNA (uracil1498-N3)-methyltransferase